MRIGQISVCNQNSHFVLKRNRNYCCDVPDSAVDKNVNFKGKFEKWAGSLVGMATVYVAPLAARLQTDDDSSGNTAKDAVNNNDKK